MASNKSLVTVLSKPHTIPSKPSFPQNTQTLKTLKLIYSNENPLFQLLKISNKTVATKAIYPIGLH